MHKVLVIGANGFVGNAVINALRASTSFQPVAGTRRSNGAIGGIEHRLCDATNRKSLERALEGVDSVVCCMLGTGTQMIEATQLLCETASQGKARQIVLMSSMSVYGSAEGWVDEGAPLAGGELGAYGAAKMECERIAADFIASGSCISILRPGIVYGPGGDQWIGRFGRLLRAGRVGDLGALGDGICNLVYKDDVGAAAVAALSSADAVGQAFNLSDGDYGTWNDFLIELGCLIGLPYVRRISPRRIRVEARLAAPPLQVLQLAQKRTLKNVPIRLDPIPPSLVALWGQRMRLSQKKADRVLGVNWTARARGLALSAEWLLADHRTASRSRVTPRELQA